jgi:hypothetical protein
MRRREVEVGVCDPGIGGADLNSRQAALAGSLPGSPGQAWVDRDQQRADSVPWSCAASIGSTSRPSPAHMLISRNSPDSQPAISLRARPRLAQV